MAENNWGKSPPKGKSFLSPDMIKESFWGPAEVPDQVRGMPRVTTWGGPRPWEAGERPSGIEKGAHDSWVSGEAKKGTMQSSFTGSSGETTSSTYSGEGVETTKPEGIAPTVREQSGGDPDSWVGGEIKKGTAQSAFTGTNLETSGSIYSAKGVQAEKPDTNAPTVREQKGGDPDSWVGGEIKKGTMQSTFEGTDFSLFSNTYKQVAKDELAQSTFQGTDMALTSSPAAKPIEKDINGKMDSWVGGLVREQKGGKANSWVGAEIKKGTLKQSTFTGTDLSFSGSTTYSAKNREFTAPTPVFQAPAGKGGFDPSGGFTKKSKSDGYVDPFIGGWNFKVKIDGIPETHSKFVSISGITMETENIEFKYGEDKFLRRIPGKEKFGEVELSRIFQVGSSGFSQWRSSIATGKDDTRTVTIQVYHTDFEDIILEITLEQAYISKWESPELNAGASDGATEKITLVPHHIVVKDILYAPKPSSKPMTVGKDSGTAPSKPLSLSDYNQKIKKALDAAMKRMGTTKDLKNSENAQQKEKEKQAKKAAAFRKKKADARTKKAKANEKARKKADKKPKDTSIQPRRDF